MDIVLHKLHVLRWHYQHFVQQATSLLEGLNINLGNFFSQKLSRVENHFYEVDYLQKLESSALDTLVFSSVSPSLGSCVAMIMPTQYVQLVNPYISRRDLINARARTRDLS